MGGNSDRSSGSSGSSSNSPGPAAFRQALTSRLEQGVQQLALQLDMRQTAQLLAQLQAYLALLVKWNAVYNLTAVRDPLQMVSQHLLDTLAVLPAFGDAQNVLDVGAGGGLPGVVLALWAALVHPDMRISMIDSVHKKTAFLTQVKTELGLHNVTIYSGRVEQLQVEQPFDVITSRAFAELADFVSWSQHLLAPGGRFIALKGLYPTAELARLPAVWQVSAVLPVQVPGLDVQRHLVIVQRTSATGAGSESLGSPST